MILLIAKETRKGGDVQLTQSEWSVLRSELVTLRNGAEIAGVIDRAATGAQPGRPFRASLRRSQLDLLEAAAARLPD